MGEVVAVQPFNPPPSGFNIVLLHAQVSFTSKAASKGAGTTLDAVALSKFLINRFGSQVIPGIKSYLEQALQQQLPHLWQSDWPEPLQSLGGV